MGGSLWEPTRANESRYVAVASDLAMGDLLDCTVDRVEKSRGLIGSGHDECRDAVSSFENIER